MKRMWQLSWPLLAALAAAMLMLARDHSRTKKYRARHAWGGRRFWSHTNAAVIPWDSLAVPRQLPGPMDTWAGSETNEIRILAPRHWGDTFLRVHVADGHDTAAPLLELSVNGVSQGQQRVAKGSGSPSRSWATGTAFPDVRFRISQSLLGRQTNSIALRSVDGSWVAMDGISIGPATARRWRILAGLLLAPFLVSWIFEETLLSRGPRRTPEGRAAGKRESE